MAQNTQVLTEVELAGLTKYAYLDIRTNLFPATFPVLSMMEKRTRANGDGMSWGGKGFVFDAIVQPEVNMGFSDAGYLGFSSDAPEVNGLVGVARSYMTRQFDNLIPPSTNTKQKAFAWYQKKILDAFAFGLKWGATESIQGNGTGVRAILASSGSTTTFTATSPYGVVGSGQGGLFLYPNMYISVLSANGVTNRGTAQISAATNSGNTVSVTLATPISGMISTDIVVQAMLTGTSYGAYTNGFINITNRGGAYPVLHGISASDYSRWNATQYVAGTNTDSLDVGELDIWSLSASIAATSGMDPRQSPDEFVNVTTTGLQLSMIQSILGQRQLPISGMDMVTLPNGYKAEKIGGIPLIADSYTPLGTWYQFHTKSLQWFDLKDWSAVEYENSGSMRFVDGRDATSLSYSQYWNIMTDRRNAHGSITGYTDATPFTPVTA